VAAKKNRITKESAGVLLEFLAELVLCSSILVFLLVVCDNFSKFYEIFAMRVG
jgi:hypothetical protein